MLARILAIFTARNREFVRDRASLAWNLLLPFALIIGLAVVFGGDGRDQYTVGVLQEQEAQSVDPVGHPFLETKYVDFVPFEDLEEALRKVEHHQVDLVMRIGPPVEYWINPDSPNGYFAEKLLLESQQPGSAPPAKREIPGAEIRYVDWVLPGILGMNMMFSCLFGVGYVVVRYRKNGFLKRLRATPLRPAEFLVAQIASRLVLILSVTIVVFTGTHLLLGTMMEGSYLVLLLIAILGSVTLIAMSLLIAARVTSEELAGGLLNMISWPMMMLSGVWFSLESAGPVVQRIAQLLPLTQILDAARAVMLDGATLLDVLPHLLVLAAMTAVFLTLGAVSFRWSAS
jgi:ABC-2 type transport system permease protein